MLLHRRLSGCKAPAKVATQAFTPVLASAELGGEAPATQHEVQEHVHGDLALEAIALDAVAHCVDAAAPTNTKRSRG